MRPFRRSTSILPILLALSCGASETLSFTKEIKPLLDVHCISCHNPKKKKGGVDLTVATTDANALHVRKLWKRALEQIETGDMPPEDGKPLNDAQKRTALAWMAHAQTAIDFNDPIYQNPGPAIVRRLNRNEYNTALRDLTGLNLDVASSIGIPEDTVTNGFDNLATALTVQSALMEKYFAGADRVLDELFAEKDGKKLHARELDAVLSVKSVEKLTDREAAKKNIEAFASRAYRRPLEKEELERFMKIYDRVDARPNRFEFAMRWMLKSALVSPNFLLRIEADQGAKESKASYRVNDYELATRLSFFLWSSIPDAELARLAGEKKLSDPLVYEQQVRRMLADPKAHALTENFSGQWLQIRKLQDARPSTEFFPSFTRDLKDAMYAETALFFDTIRKEDGSLLQLLDANYTFINEELAAHYGIPNVKGKELRKVALQPNGPRGGLTGMASVLAMTSHTHRTSPTLRGKYILEVVLGAPPPPPPANVSQIKEEHEAGKEPKSFRELLAQHANDASCNVCHKRIDPLGFGLENFDAIGRWRDSHGGHPIDSSGELPGGRKFAGAVQLKQILLERKDEFVKNVVEQMTMYALGRELKYYDDGTLFQIQSALKKDGFKFSTLVLGIVKSPQFQMRRNTDVAEQ